MPQKVKTRSLGFKKMVSIYKVIRIIITFVHGWLLYTETRENTVLEMNLSFYIWPVGREKFYLQISSLEYL